MRQDALMQIGKRLKRNKGNIKAYVSVFIGLTAVVLFFMGGGFVTYSNKFILKKDSGLVAHTHEIIISLDNLFSLMKDAETGQRGYVLTGKDGYLDPYDAALRLLDVELDKLRQMTKDNPEQQERIPAIKVMINAKLQELAETIDLRRKQGFEQALAVVVTDRCKKVMDDFRAALAVMRQTEIDLRIKRIAEMENAYEIAITAGITSALLGIFLSIAIAGLLRHAAELRRREEWLQTGQVGLSAAMLGDLSVDQLGENILKFLAEYFDAHAGIFFVKDGSRYKRSATYGFPIDGAAPKSFEGNDGLLGQAVKDARAFIVRGAPEGYLMVGSGLGHIL